MRFKEKIRGKADTQSTECTSIALVGMQQSSFPETREDIELYIFF